MHEPSKEELDATVAERMKPENLPAWWFKPDNGNVGKVKFNSKPKNKGRKKKGTNHGRSR